MILRWTERGFVWTLGDGWGENGPFTSYREAIDDYEIYRQSHDATSPGRDDIPSNPAVSSAPPDPHSPTGGAFSFVDLLLSNDV